MTGAAAVGEHRAAAKHGHWPVANAARNKHDKQVHRRDFSVVTVV